MVTTSMISPEALRERRKAAGHKQESLALALRCSPTTIRNFERRKTSRLYSVQWEALAKELGLGAGE